MDEVESLKTIITEKNKIIKEQMMFINILKKELKKIITRTDEYFENK